MITSTRAPRRRTRLVLGAALLLAACQRRAVDTTPARDRTPLFDPASAIWQTPAPTTYRVLVESSVGRFTLEVQRDWAPRGADRLYHLVDAGFYDNSRLSRVVPGFIAQFGVPGDPKVSAIWKDRRFPDDPVRQSNVRGTIAFAMTGPDTRTHQLFISLVDNTRLDAQGFSPIGRVVEGMDVVDRLYGGYGETSGGGMRAGRQQQAMEGGNAWFDANFPKLDRLVRAVIVTR